MQTQGDPELGAELRQLGDREGELSMRLPAIHGRADKQLARSQFFTVDTYFHNLSFGRIENPPLDQGLAPARGVAKIFLGHQTIRATLSNFLAARTEMTGPTHSSETRLIRVACDFGADGLWGLPGGAITPEALGLSPALSLALAAWQAHYEELCWQVEKAKPQFDFEAHDAIGRRIAKLVRAERPDLWVVYGWDSDREKPSP